MKAHSLLIRVLVAVFPKVEVNCGAGDIQRVPLMKLIYYGIERKRKLRRSELKGAAKQQDQKEKETQRKLDKVARKYTA